MEASVEVKASATLSLGKDPSCIAC